MKKLFSKHYRKVFEREPVALVGFMESVTKKEEMKRILSGEVQDGDNERFLLETYLELRKSYGPIKSRKILKQLVKIICLMWR